jgi:hypothetical protein
MTAERQTSSWMSNEERYWPRHRPLIATIVGAQVFDLNGHVKRIISTSGEHLHGLRYGEGPGDLRNADELIEERQRLQAVISRIFGSSLGTSEIN